MKVKCIKDVPFVPFKKGAQYCVENDNVYCGSMYHKVSENGKLLPVINQYFEIVPEKDFDWYLKETLIKLRIETGIFALKLVEDSIDMFKQNTLSLIARRLLISETYKTIAEELNEGWVADWKNKYEVKWYNSYDYDDNKIYQYENTSSGRSLNNVYFHSEGAAEKAAKIMGDYLKEL